MPIRSGTPARGYWILHRDAGPLKCVEAAPGGEHNQRQVPEAMTSRHLAGALEGRFRFGGLALVRPARQHGRNVRVLQLWRARDEDAGGRNVFGSELAVARLLAAFPQPGHARLCELACLRRQSIPLLLVCRVEQDEGPDFLWITRP